MRAQERCSDDAQSPGECLGVAVCIGFMVSVLCFVPPLCNMKLEKGRYPKKDLIALGNGQRKSRMRTSPASVPSSEHGHQVEFPSA